MLRQGTLWRKIVETTARALASGALVPVPTDHRVIDEQGIHYLVRVLAGLRRKDQARREQDEAARAGNTFNPFLPPEAALTVGELTDTHLAILNKFNVVEHHLLIVTRLFEDQKALLTQRDFEALWLCMAEYDGLGFYNGGKEGGASQEHKHLQVVPLPLAKAGPAVPVEPLLADATISQGKIATVPAFPFLHAFIRLESGLWRTPVAAATRTFELYAALLGFVGMTSPAPGKLVKQSLPYCLLVTRQWMLLVPRSREHFEGISLNSLAFAGSFFVRDEHQMEVLRRAGPLRALAETALPRESAL